MSTSQNLTDLYDDYYESGSVDDKRKISARQTVARIKKMVNLSQCETLLDIGAGNGSVIQQLSKEGFSGKISAVEISESGLEAIKKRQIAELISAKKFDGYKIDARDNEYDLGISAHVLEHVEHERLFIQEAARVCKKLFIEVPLEHTAKINRGIELSRPFGHINYYTKETVRNLIETSGLKIDSLEVFHHDLAYEQYCAGKAKGTIKHFIRKSALACIPSVAERRFVYVAGITCEKTNEKFQFKGH